MEEASHNPGSITCLIAREVLSDLIDTRHGETPNSSGTFLSEPEGRQAVEFHVAGCGACRQELEDLETIGAAFADFAVGEAPPQHFEDYAQKVRARLAGVSEMRVIERVVVSCFQARAVLSDLIDIQRGETPHKDGTTLAQPEIHSAVEAHLQECDSCREEMWALEQVGAAFADFSAGEESIQHFESYGYKVRARLAKAARNDPAQIARSRKQMRWMALGVSGLAASLALILSHSYGVHQNTGVRPGVENTTIAQVNPRASEKRIASVRTIAPVQMFLPRVTPLGTQLVSQEFDPAQPAMSQLPPEGSVGYYVVAEKPSPGERPLLGAYLKTTRGMDKDVSQDPDGLMVYDVVPGSPAYNMGLQKDDYIFRINDKDIHNGGVEQALDLISYIKQQGEGASVTVYVIRANKTLWCFLKPSTAVLGNYDFKSNERLAKSLSF